MHVVQSQKDQWFTVNYQIDWIEQKVGECFTAMSDIRQKIGKVDEEWRKANKDAVPQWTEVSEEAARYFPQADSKLISDNWELIRATGTKGKGNLGPFRLLWKQNPLESSPWRLAASKLLEEAAALQKQRPPSPAESAALEANKKAKWREAEEADWIAWTPIFNLLKPYATSLIYVVGGVSAVTRYELEINPSALRSAGFPASRPGGRLNISMLAQIPVVAEVSGCSAYISLSCSTVFL